MSLLFYRIAISSIDYRQLIIGVNNDKAFYVRFMEVCNLSPAADTIKTLRIWHQIKLDPILRIFVSLTSFKKRSMCVQDLFACGGVSLS